MLGQQERIAGLQKILSFADPALKPGCEKNVLVRSKHPLSLFTFWKWLLHLINY